LAITLPPRVAAFLRLCLCISRQLFDLRQKWLGEFSACGVAVLPVFDQLTSAQPVFGRFFSTFSPSRIALDFSLIS
jgi:hypothetical protein